MTYSTFDMPSQCPYCGRVHKAASGPDTAGGASNGDASICIGCGHVGIFDSAAPGGIRRTTPQEAARIATNPNIARALLAWRMMDQRRRAEAIYSSKSAAEKGTDK